MTGRKAYLVLFLCAMSQQRAAGATDYVIRAELDVAGKLIHGSQAVEWFNSSSVEVSDLRFHLYFNAWRDRRSSFMSALSPRGGSRTWKEQDRGAIDVTSVRVQWEPPEGTVLGPFDLGDRTEFIQPDDGNPHDRTVLRIPLPQPVSPGAKVRIEMEFTTRVPRTIARTGFRGDYFFLAHWFPKLGVLEEGEWNCHQFIQTEFFSDFGDYDVSLTLPAGWIVGATGRPVEIRNDGQGRATHRYTQRNVHEFAWTASPHFLDFERKFEHPGLPAVDIRLLLMSDHKGQEGRYLAATEAALRYYGEWFGAYPYGHVTVVDPAYRSGTGGMEYPTLFTGGTRWLNPSGSGSPEGVTVHECGHQFWYGIVANNEFEDAWLDEGFNTYSTRQTMAQAFPDTFLVDRYLDGFVPLIFRDLPRSERSVSGLGGYYSPLKTEIMAKPSWQQGPPAFRAAGDRTGSAGRQSPYVLNAYTKPAMMLVTLQRHLGWETFQKVMSTYFERFRFRHPEPADFFEVADAVSGQDLEWFWRETYRSSNIFDYAVDAVLSRDSGEIVVVRRWGEGIFPIAIRVSFEDGRVAEETWDGEGRWVRFDYPPGEAIVLVEVDPDEILALDVNRINNSWKRDSPAGLAAAKWSLKWAVWLQHMLEFFAFAG